MRLGQRKKIQTLTDEELLVELIHSGDMTYWGELYERYATLCLGVCMKYLKNRGQAEDAMMEVFEQLPEKVKKSEIRKFRSWFHTVIRNHCLMFLRKRDALNEAGEIADYSFGEEDNTVALDQEVLLNGMADCLDKLKLEQQTCVKRFFLEQKCYQDIAEETGYELKKVKSYIQNGKRNLKICMDRKEAQNA